MTLLLNHVQRLNLKVMVGALVADIGSIRAHWALQDKLMLTDEEAVGVGLTSAFVGGREIYNWLPDSSLVCMHIELDEREKAIVEQAIQAWPSYQISQARGWLPAILEQLGIPLK